MISDNILLIFDWGDTIMRDLDLNGAMKDWPVVEWVPGAKEMLIQVSKSFVCCIATSAAHSDTTDMIIALQRVGAEKYFTHFFSSNDLGHSKPDPAFFSAIARILDFEPADCVSIGNLYEKDIVPAKKAGLLTIWFNENKTDGQWPMADHIIYNWKQLTDVLDKHIR